MAACKIKNRTAFPNRNIYILLSSVMSPFYWLCVFNSVCSILAYGVLLINLNFTLVFFSFLTCRRNVFCAEYMWFDFHVNYYSETYIHIKTVGRLVVLNDLKNFPFLYMAYKYILSKNADNHSCNNFFWKFKITNYILKSTSYFQSANFVKEFNLQFNLNPNFYLFFFFKYLYIILNNCTFYNFCTQS